MQILPLPEPFYLTLSIAVTIHSTLDRDSHLNINEQLQLCPQLELKIGSSNIISPTPEELTICCANLQKKINVTNTDAYRDFVERVFA